MCSSLNVVMYSFCVLSTRSKLGPNLGAFSSLPPHSTCLAFLLTLQWSISNLLHFFQLWQWVPHPLVSSFSRILHPLGLFLIISAFASNRSSTPTGPFDSSNFNFPKLDQILDFVFEGVAIFCRVTWNPSVVVVSNIDIVPSEKWGPERCQIK